MLNPVGVLPIGGVCLEMGFALKFDLGSMGDMGVA